MRRSTLCWEVGLGLLLLGTTLHLVAICTPYYLYLSDSDIRAVHAILSSGSLRSPSPLSNSTVGVHLGLWQICIDSAEPLNLLYSISSPSASSGLPKKDNNNETETLCLNISPINSLRQPDWLSTCQALSLLGLLNNAAALIWLLGWGLSLLGKSRPVFMALTVCNSFLGGLFILVTNIVFITEGSLAFLAQSGQLHYFFSSSSVTHNAYDSQLTTGWSQILDIIGGSITIISCTFFLGTMGLVSVQKASDKQGKWGEGKGDIGNMFWERKKWADTQL